MKVYHSAILLLLLFCVNRVHAQSSFIIKGNITDTVSDAKLKNATITLMRAKDSVLISFARSGEDGNFELKTTKEDSYILMVAFPSFADYVDVVQVSKPLTNLGLIPMISKSHLLNEFVLKQQIAAIKIKGDTTEYMADSFKVRENATVEELLKKLPGIQVNKDGVVTAQGEKVQKILVDGEEFFTDDPAVVTKSLQAKAVEKVQVYDKKSDQSIFSGIDDGTREKTINLKLKDNMKKGYFGKVVAGGGTDGFFENQLMLNAFKKKRKISVFGIVANTGKIGLGWDEASKFGGGNGTISVSDEGITSTYISDGDDFESWGGTYDGKGLPTAWTGGAHYSNRWFEDKLHFNTNYRYAKRNIETINNDLTELNFEQNKLFTNAKDETFSSGEKHKIDMANDWKVDSTSEIRLSANANYVHNINTSTGYTETNNGAGQKLNDNTNSKTSDGNSKAINATLNWRKKFAKKGRTLVFTADENYKESKSNTYINAQLNYYNINNPNQLDSSRVNNQLKDNDTKNLELEGKLSYTEPLSKKIFLEINYTAKVNNSSAKKLSYDKRFAQNAYDSLNLIYSSNYDFNIFTNTGGSNLRFVLKSLNFSVGGAVSNTQFNQRDNLGTNRSYNRSFTNFFPKASINYRPEGKQRSISLNYQGYTQQPTIDQIQPLRQNTDLLNISIGNPDLKQEFNHNIRINYNSYKVLSSTYTYGGLSTTFINHDISQSQTINPGGQRVYQYVNVDGNYRGHLYAGYGKDLKKWDMRIGANINAGMNQTNSIVNGLKNKSNNNNISVGIELNYDKEKKFNISYNPSVSYNNNMSSINATSTNYWALQNQFDANVQLPLKFEIGTDIDWYIRQKVAGFDRNNDVFRWNAYVSKKFLKSDALELRASVFDILNQNIGFQRYGSGNTVNEQNYNTIRRYGMLSLIWNFTKTAAGAPQEEGTQFIIN